MTAAWAEINIVLAHQSVYAQIGTNKRMAKNGGFYRDDSVFSHVHATL